MLLLLAAFSSQGAAEDDPTKAVGAALGKTAYPWYDAANDRAKTVAMPDVPKQAKSEPSGDPSSLKGAGDIVAYVVFGVVLGGLVALLIWFWRIYEPIDEGSGPSRSKGPGEASSVEALPPGMRREFASSDPWDEAKRRRDRGDLAGAVVCLFAHQLLTLGKLGLVRLAPGRTGRQLLRAVHDAEFRALTLPTLRLFEAVYYGHRIPTPAEFAVVWQSAEAFERRAAQGVIA
jgi:hypothetical protein